MDIRRLICFSSLPLFLTSCFCTEEKLDLDFVFGQTADDVDDFMQTNNLTSIDAITCEAVCADFDPSLVLRSCELTWDQEYLDSLPTEDPQRESPVDTGPYVETVNTIRCEGYNYSSCD